VSRRNPEAKRRRNAHRASQSHDVAVRREPTCPNCGEHVHPYQVGRGHGRRDGTWCPGTVPALEGTK
jgi:hypothetical protein